MEGKEKGGGRREGKRKEGEKKKEGNFPSSTWSFFREGEKPTRRRRRRTFKSQGRKVKTLLFFSSSEGLAQSGGRKELEGKGKKSGGGSKNRKQFATTQNGKSLATG